MTASAWDDGRLSFDHKPFLARRIPMFFRIPVGLGDEIASLRERACRLGLTPPVPPMVLQRDSGFFRGELLVAIAQPVTVPEVRILTGTYRTAVHRGSYAHLGRAARRLLARLRRELGIKPAEVFFWYANCPRCWRKDGGPLTIVLARTGNPEADVRP